MARFGVVGGGTSYGSIWIALPAGSGSAFPDYMVGGGFTSRMIFVYTDKKRQFVAYPKKHFDPAVEALRDNLIHDLKQISNVFQCSYGRFGNQSWVLTHKCERQNSG